jgi:hypothetical protein
MGGLCLLDEAESWFCEHGMALSMSLISCKSVQYRLLRRSGYIPLPGFLSPKTFRFGVYVHVDQRHDMPSLSAKDWLVTIADYESF